MNKFKLSFLGILALIGLFVVGNINTASAQTATPTCTNAVWSAVLDGTVYPNGVSTQAWFEWGTNTSVQYATPSQTFTQNSNFSQTLTPLNENTTYYFRAMAQNKYGTATGSTKSFSTSTCSQPVQNPTVSLTADSTNIAYNGSTTLRWNSTNANYCSSANFSTNNSASGSTSTGNLTNSKTYNITCYGASGTSPASSSVTVSVGSAPPVQTPNPTASLTADSTSIPYNGSTTLRWSSTNSHYCVGTNFDTNNRPTTGSASTGILTNTRTYTVTCYDGNGANPASSSVTVSVGSAPVQAQNPTVSLTADSTNIAYNGSTTLRWNSTNANYCSSANFSTNNSASGSTSTGNLTNSKTYNITCYGASGTSPASSSVTVSVGSAPVQAQNPTVSLTADNSNVNFNGSTILRWTSNNATSCSASGGTNGWSGAKSIGNNNSFHTGALTSTMTYYITCQGESGTNPASSSVTVNTGSQVLNPTVSITSNPSNVQSNQSSTLSWTSQNATSCSASGGTNGWSGAKNMSGTFNTLPLSNTTTYYITCTNNSGSASDSTTVAVNQISASNPTIHLTAYNYNVNFNGSTLLRWTSNNATSCSASGGTNGWSGSKSTNNSWGFHTGALTNTTTYNITCYGESGTNPSFSSVTVNVGGQTTTQRCLDVTASNYNSFGSCIYTPRCLDVSAINYNSIGSCVYNTVSNQPTVAIFADSTNIAFNSSTTVRWGSTNATSCSASGGSTGWAGAKSIGPGAFFTGSLTGSRTYTITCTNNVGSATDSVTVNVRGQVQGSTTTVVRQAPTALVLVTSSVDRNQPIIPTLDNTSPCPGDQINYTVTYQNIGTGSVPNLVLRLDLPYEVDYISSNPNNPTRSGNTLTFNLGTLRANGEGTVTVRVRVRDNIPAGTHLNFPATLNYVDPSGFPQSVHANVSAQVCGTLLAAQDNASRILLGANIFGSGGFMPGSIFGWLLLLVLILLLMLLAKHILAQSRQPAHPHMLQSAAAPYRPRKVTTTTVEEN